MAKHGNYGKYVRIVGKNGKYMAILAYFVKYGIVFHIQQNLVKAIKSTIFYDSWNKI